MYRVYFLKLLCGVWMVLIVRNWPMYIHSPSSISLSTDLKTFLFHSVYGHQDTDWLCDVPRSSSRGRNTSASVTVTHSWKRRRNAVQRFEKRKQTICTDWPRAERDGYERRDLTTVLPLLMWPLYLATPTDVSVPSQLSAVSDRLQADLPARQQRDLLLLAETRRWQQHLVVALTMPSPEPLQQLSASPPYYHDNTSQNYNQKTIIIHSTSETHHLKHCGVIATRLQIC